MYDDLYPEILRLWCPYYNSFYNKLLNCWILAACTPCGQIFQLNSLPQAEDAPQAILIRLPKSHILWRLPDCHETQHEWCATEGDAETIVFSWLQSGIQTQWTLRFAWWETSVAMNLDQQTRVADNPGGIMELCAPHNAVCTYWIVFLDGLRFKNEI
jgi:hypothetical protein